MKERKRRKLLRQAVAGITKKLSGKKSEPEFEPAAEPPKSGDLSYQKPASRNAVRYNPMTAPGTRMIDTRDVPYEIGKRGQLRRLRPQTPATGGRESKPKSKKEAKKGTGTEGVKV